MNIREWLPEPQGTAPDVPLPPHPAMEEEPAGTTVIIEAVPPEPLADVVVEEVPPVEPLPAPAPEAVPSQEPEAVVAPAPESKKDKEKPRRNFTGRKGKK